jgi:hypothetical protein
MKLLVVWLVSLAAGKFMSTSLSLTPSEAWQYVAKFAMNIGKGTYSLRAQLINPKVADSADSMSLSLSIYIDTKWPEILTLADCRDKDNDANRDEILSLPLNGEWSNYVEGTLTQNVKTRFWYFAVSNCEIQAKHRIRVEILFINSDNSHLSAEDRGMQYVYPVILIIYLAFLIKNTLRILISHEKQDDIPIVLLMFSAAIFTQFGGIMFKIIYLFVYWYNGRTLLVFDILSQALEVISTIIVTVLFILIANGWILKYRQFPDADIYIPISMLIVTVNFVIIILGKLSDDAYNKYSDYEGIAAFFLVLFRVLSWVWFVFAIREVEKGANMKVLNFLFKFQMLASVYFLSLPIVVLVSWIFEPYVRKVVISLLLNLVQVLVFAYASHLFSEKSEFYKLSTLSSSVLPGSLGNS